MSHLSAGGFYRTRLRESMRLEARRFAVTTAFEAELLDRAQFVEGGDRQEWPNWSCALRSQAPRLHHQWGACACGAGPERIFAAESVRYGHEETIQLAKGHITAALGG